MSKPVKRDTLVKFDPPVLASSLRERQRKFVERGGGSQPTISKQSALQTEDVLNTIIPPLEYKESGETWNQFVSSTPATRLDVVHLQERLDTLLEQRQARATGLCPVREELYTQCLDELIREVTVSCAERGVLLKRVRDELKMTLTSYQTLYESAIAFGIRKALLAEEGKVNLEKEVESLTNERNQLRQTVAELRVKLDAVERRESDKRALLEKKHADEVAFLRKSTRQLKQQLESILT